MTAMRPDHVAVRMIARALDNATMPDPTEICDRTGLTRPQVDELVTTMIHTRRDGTPRHPPTPSKTPAPPGTDTAHGVGGPPPEDPARLTLWALNHPDPDIRNAAHTHSEQLAAEVTLILADLAERDRRRRITELKAELDELQGVQRVTCPQCGQTGIRADRLHVHQARSAKHQGAGP